MEIMSKCTKCFISWYKSCTTWSYSFRDRFLWSSPTWDNGFVINKKTMMQIRGTFLLKFYSLGWCNTLLCYWLDGQKFMYNHELDGDIDTLESLSKIISGRFSMDVAFGTYKISECLLSSISRNSSICFCNSCQKVSNTKFSEQPLSFCKSHNKSLLFDSRVKLTKFYPPLPFCGWNQRFHHQ